MKDDVADLGGANPPIDVYNNRYSNMLVCQ